MKQLTFYFDFVSPYAYLAFERLPQALQGLSYTVRYQPVLLAGLLQHHGQRAPAELEPKRVWIYRQVAWQAHRLGVPLRMPAAHPFNPLSLLRLALACPEVEVPDPAAEWAPTPAVILARAIGKGLSDVDDGDRRWELDQQAVNNAYKALADGLSRHGHRASLTVRDDAILVDVMFQGRTQRVAELSAALDSEIAERERILSARHREILENQLVSEVAASLQELVTAAETQVREMNQELAARPTSTSAA